MRTWTGITVRPLVRLLHARLTKQDRSRTVTRLLDGLRAHCRRRLKIGSMGKTAIHPSRHAVTGSINTSGQGSRVALANLANLISRMTGPSTMSCRSSYYVLPSTTDQTVGPMARRFVLGPAGELCYATIDYRTVISLAHLEKA